MFKATGDDLGPKFLKIFGLKKKKKSIPSGFASLPVLELFAYVYIYI